MTKAKILLDPKKNLRQWQRQAGFVHERVLLLFWYMKPQWQYLKSLIPIKQRGGYIWPHYEAKDQRGHFSIVHIPGPGHPLLEMILFETASLGGEYFLLWGSIAKIKESWPDEAIWLWPEKSIWIEKDHNSLESKINPAQDEKSNLFSEVFIKPDETKAKANAANICRGNIWCVDSPYTLTDQGLFAAIQKECVAADMESYIFGKTIKCLQKTGYGFYYPRDTYSLNGWSMDNLDQNGHIQNQKNMRRMTDYVLDIMAKL